MYISLLIFHWRKQYYILRSWIHIWIQWLSVKNILIGIYLTDFCFHKMLIDGSCEVLVDYCDVFISCLDSHSDGTHSLQRIHWCASDVMLNICSEEETNSSTLWMSWGWVHFSANFHFWLKFPFKCFETLIFELILIKVLYFTSSPITLNALIIYTNLLLLLTIQSHLHSARLLSEVTQSTSYTFYQFNHASDSNPWPWSY